MHKFFIERSQNEQNEDSMIVLTGQESRHIALSLRMAVGDEITASDGAGTDYRCRLVRITPERTEAEILEEHTSSGEPPCFIRLFQCVPKGDKTELVIQKAVELGVSEIYPVWSEHCIVRPSAADAKKNIRYNRIALEAAKQCGRGVIPKVMPAIGFDAALGEASGSGLAFICHETVGERTLAKILPSDRPDVISFFVGPEGGFSEAEVAKAEAHGIIPVGLGQRILRAETAPMFVLSCISCKYEL